MRAEAGDTVQVVLHNALDFDVGLEPLGGAVWAADEDLAAGAHLSPAVPPGETRTLMWKVGSLACL